MREELRRAGGPDIGVAGTQTRKYERVYKRLKKGKLSEDEARLEIGRIFARGERPSTADGVDYYDYYAKEFRDQWEQDYGADTPDWLVGQE